MDLPFGAGRHYLANLHGPLNKMVSGWAVNGISTFQSGFPLAFIDASPNLLETDFAIGNGGPGPPGAGVSRPNYVSGCSKSVSGSAQSRLGA
jgi:hypothetical protein